MSLVRFDVFQGFPHWITLCHPLLVTLLHSSRHLMSPSSGHLVTLFLSLLVTLSVTTCHPLPTDPLLFSAACLNAPPPPSPASPCLQVSSIWSTDLFQPARSEDENACATMAGVMGAVTGGNPGGYMVDSLLGPTLQPPGFNEEW